MPYRIRIAHPGDVPAIAERYREQNERDGTNYPLPEIFTPAGKLAPMVALALVIEDEDGVVQQGIVFEKAVEMMMFGCDPKATAFYRREIAGSFYLLRQQGYEVVHCFVPKQVVLRAERPLERVGFARDDFRLAHFCKDLRLDEPEMETPGV